MVEAIIAPSLLSCDFARLGDEANRMLALSADWLHVDIMDGHFVPNLTLGPPIVKHLAKACPKGRLDCHMMVDDPLRWLDALSDASIYSMTIHVEAPAFAAASSAEHHALLIKALRQIKAKNVRAAFSVKPGTAIEPYIDLIRKEGGPAGLLDMILVMTVEPGFGGQSFMRDCLAKVKLIRAAFPTLDIEVDGGLNQETVKEAAEAGANVIVAGSAIFQAEDQHMYIQSLRKPVTAAIPTWVSS